MHRATMTYNKAATFVFFFALLMFPFMLFSAIAAPAPAPDLGGMDVYCGSRCRGRCAKAGLQDRCLRYCGICCRECKCVPSGTFGNKHQCPCYRDKLSSKGTPKCP